MPKIKHYCYLAIARSALYFVYILRVVNHAFRRLPQNRKSIVFYLENESMYRQDDGMGRYVYLLVNRFSRAGYNVYFYKNITSFDAYLRLGKYGRFLLDEPRLKFISKIPNSLSIGETLMAFDQYDKLLFSYKWKKLMFVNICKPTSCQIGELVWIPYFFHPIANWKKMSKKINHLRKNKHKLRILFAGNSAAKGYSVKKLRDWYNKITRHEAIMALMELKDVVKNVIDSAAFCKAMDKGNYVNECRLLRTNIATKLDMKDYWKIISKSDFFLALPGTDYPMCHNIMESMSLGTIPIMDYSDWFFPALEHGKNAIIYEDEKDLQNKIREVLSFDIQTIEKMRHNVIAYNDQYLSNRSFIENVERVKDKVMTLMLLPRLVCTAKENEEGRQLIEKINKKIKGRLASDNNTTLEKKNV